MEYRHDEEPALKGIPSRIMKSPLLAALFRWVMGVLFIYAGSTKVMDPWSFSEAIANYRLLPDALIGPMALWLPWLEVLAGLTMVAGRWVKGGALILSVLALVFTAAVGSALYRGLDISCGCFLIEKDVEVIQWYTMAGNLGLLAMALQVLFFDRGTFKISLRPPR
jgi:putative oxidoreductase